MDPAWIKKDFLHLRLDVAAVASQLEAEGIGLHGLITSEDDVSRVEAMDSDASYPDSTIFWSLQSGNRGWGGNVPGKSWGFEDGCATAHSQRRAVVNGEELAVMVAETTSRARAGTVHCTEKVSNRCSLSPADRNRMRQKRFYHKRKAKMNELEYQVQSLIEEVERLKLEKSSLSTRHHFLTKIAEHREDQLQLLRESAQIKQTENSTPGCDSPTQSSVYGTAGPWRAQLYSVSDVLSMSSEELQKLCQDYIRKVSSLLQNSAGEESIEEVTKHIGELLSKWTTLVPDAPRLLLCTHLDAGALAELPPEWEARRQTESLLRKIEITDQQRGYILELHQKLRRNLECAKHKQRELSKELKLYLKSTEYIIAPRVLSGQPLELEDIIYKLKDAVSSQWEEWLYFLDAICHVVLSPLQVARMALCSYPYTPDMVGLALLIAEEEAAKIQ